MSESFTPRATRPQGKGEAPFELRGVFALVVSGRALACRRGTFEGMSGLWQNLRTPTLFVSGTEGYWSKLSYRNEMIGAVPGARVVTLEGAGHWVHHDRFDEFITLLRDFLN